MAYLNYIVLGIVQGLTEFLPVSSSGHLVLFQALFGMEMDNGLLIEVLLHMGTLVAVIVCFWKDISELLREAVLFFPRLVKKEPVNTPGSRMLGYILLTLIPLCILVPFKDQIEYIYRYPIIVGFALLVTGVVLILSDRSRRGIKDVTTMNWFDAIVIGIAQALALTPGLSRSGMTISAGLFRKFTRESAVKFSFIMGIPAILGSFVLEMKDAIEAGITLTDLGPALAGMVASALFGYLAIRFVQFIVKKDKFTYFAYYCFAVGVITIVASVLRG